MTDSRYSSVQRWALPLTLPRAFGAHVRQSIQLSSELGAPSHPPQSIWRSLSLPPEHLALPLTLPRAFGAHVRQSIQLDILRPSLGSCHLTEYSSRRNGVESSWRGFGGALGLVARFLRIHTMFLKMLINFFKCASFYCPDSTIP